MLPGLYEAFSPGGISALDDISYLISMMPVAGSEGDPSIIVRMEMKKNGSVMRLFQLYEVDGTPFNGTVRDVTVTGRDNVWPPMPKYVWTCDDTNSS